MTIVALISHLFPAINFKTNKSLCYFALTANKYYKHAAKFSRDLLLCKMSTSVNGVHITSALLSFHLKKINASTNHVFIVYSHFKTLKQIHSLPARNFFKRRLQKTYHFWLKTYLIWKMVGGGGGGFQEP